MKLRLFYMWKIKLILVSLCTLILSLPLIVAHIYEFRHWFLVLFVFPTLLWFATSYSMCKYDPKKEQIKDRY